MTLHIDGFDHFQGEIDLIPALKRAGYAIVGSKLTIVGGRSNGIISRSVSIYESSMSREHPWAGPVFTAGAVVMAPLRGSLLWLTLGSEELVLWLSPTNGHPYLNASPGQALPLASRWYYYELVLDRAALTASLLINGRAEISVPITALMAAQTSVTTHFGTHAPSTFGTSETIKDTGVKQVDDIYLHDGGPLNPIAITTRLPKQDMTDPHEWAATNGGHYGEISKLPPMPLESFIATEVIGLVDKFTSTDLLTNGPIVATAMVVLARKSEGFDARLDLFLGGDGTAAERRATRTVESAWRTQYVVFPGNGSDTKANLEAAPFGVKTVA